MLYFVDFLIAHTGVFILFLVLALSGVALIWAGITHFRYVKYAQEGRIDIGGQVLKAILKAALLALLASLALVRLLLGDYRSATLDQPRSEATQGFRNGRARPGEEDEEREYKAETAVYIGSLRIIGGIALFIFGIVLVFCFIIFDEVSWPMHNPRWEAILACDSEPTGSLVTYPCCAARGPHRKVEV